MSKYWQTVIEKYMEKIIEEVRSYVLEETFLKDERIKNDTLLFAHGFFDSMGFVRLITFLEDKFSITISDEDLLEENFESISAIGKFIERKTM